MRDFPSVLLRLVGVVLIVLGLSGIALGAYTYKTVYEYNLGSSRGDVKEAIAEISSMQKKLEEDKGEIKAAVDKATSSLKKSGEAASESGRKLNSPELVEMGEGLEEASDSLQVLNTLVENVITDVSQPLSDTVDSLELVVEMASSIKAIAYALILYLIFVHLVIIGIGIALLAIEANLFYYPEEE
ncbi:MAG: hypothetical protein V3R82_03435 [Candidatus Hydrothermarchaeales archaeon]